MMSLHARIISIIVGLALFAAVSFLVRRRRLHNIYSVTWFLISLSLIGMGVIPNFAEGLAVILGVGFTPAAVLVAAVGCILIILLHLSLIVSDQHKLICHLEREIALLGIRAKDPKN